MALLVIVGKRQEIEYDLGKRATAALHGAGLTWAVPTFEGHDGALRGTTESKAERDQGLAIMRNVAGVGDVRDKVRLLERVSPYTWWAILEAGQVKIKGHVPTKKDKLTIVGIAKANLPELEIDDRTDRAAGVPSRQIWLGAISFALKQLAHLKHGSARLVDTELTLSGEARTAAAFREIRTALKSERPEGLTLKADAVRPPVVTPFLWGAHLEKGSLTLTGHVPDEVSRVRIKELARASFARRAVVDRMELAAGVPEQWSAAVTVILKQLSRLATGKAALSGVSLTIEGVAKDAAAAEDVVRAVRGGLPAIYKSDETIGVEQRAAPQPKEAPPKKDDKAEAPSPTAAGSERSPAARSKHALQAPNAAPFVWSASRDGRRLTLSGHIPSEESRRVLMQAARLDFPDSSVDDHMMLASGAPEGWLGVARLGLSQLRDLPGGEVRLMDHALHLSGTAASAAAAANIRKLVASALPQPYAANDQVRVVAGVRPLAEQQDAEARRCQARMDRILDGNAIRFEPGRARLLRDSVQVLAMLADAAKQCPRARIVIAGHADSEGDPMNSRVLSSRRAQEVVAILVARGIAGNRLKAIGYGTGRAPAPNGKPLNDARNRRIEFRVEAVH